MSSQPPFDAAELERRLRAVVPAARVVRERHLRKLLRKLADEGEPVAVNPRLPVWAAAARVRDADVFQDDVKGSPAGSLREYLDAFFARYLKGAPASVLHAFPRVMSQGFDGRWRTTLPLTVAPPGTPGRWTRRS